MSYLLISCKSPQSQNMRRYITAVSPPSLTATAHYTIGSKYAQHADCVVSQKHQNDFASKTDIGSAELYFHYYGMLMHQQNMLQDQIRTGTYYAAILENPTDFQDKVVMDVGAGSGILSLFAAQVAYPIQSQLHTYFTQSTHKAHAQEPPCYFSSCVCIQLCIQLKQASNLAFASSSNMLRCDINHRTFLQPDCDNIRLQLPAIQMALLLYGIGRST